MYSKEHVLTVWRQRIALAFIISCESRGNIAKISHWLAELIIFDRRKKNRQNVNVSTDSKNDWFLEDNRGTDPHIEHNIL